MKIAEHHAKIGSWRSSRWLRCALVALCFLFLWRAGPATAAEGRVVKVLPQYLDLKGRAAISPSLYDRDAYQVHLRDHPAERSTMRFVVQWKTREADPDKLRLRVELRGVAAGNLPKEIVLEQNVKPKGWFSNWAVINLTPDQYHTLTEVISWRVTLWQGETLLGTQESFLWQ
jgi:hypothetical protein